MIAVIRGEKEFANVVYITDLEGKTFYGLSRLESLLLSDSSISKISPTVFTYTSSLLYLDLSNNKLTTITMELAALTKLETLILSGNMVSTECIVRNVKAVRRYTRYKALLYTFIFKVIPIAMRFSLGDQQRWKYIGLVLH